MATREKILFEAGKLFSQRGYFAVSMEDIAQSVGVTKATLYHHFRSKEDICRELVSSACEELKKRIQVRLHKDKNPINALFGVVLTMLDVALERPEILLMNSLEMVSDDRTPVVQYMVNLRTEILRFLRDVLVKLDVTQKRTSRYAFELAEFLIGLVFSPITQQRQESKITAKRIVRFLFPEQSS
ncbi:MAG TPA: TetR/AcrR family transcriptional regulator [Patescibacteria group bacterium]|nr:TetR/AcrR family transcriptional regulator [Patescibacteria group bacterium]